MGSQDMQDMGSSISLSLTEHPGMSVTHVSWPIATEAA